MNNLIIGIVCFVFALFLYFLSPSEGKNMLGYKSPQQGTHKNIWKWSNKCFGILAIAGASIYLLAAIILRILSIGEYDSKINLYGMIYIIICIIITETYTFIRSQKSR